MSKTEAKAKATEHDSEEDDKYQKQEKHEDHGVFADAELKLSPVYI